MKESTIGTSWYDGTITYQGIVHNAQNKNSLPCAQVHVPAINGKMDLTERNNLPWFVIALGGGTGAGGDASGHTLFPGQNVEVTQNHFDMTAYTITRKLSTVEPKAKKTGGPSKGGAASGGSSKNPNTVTPLSEDGKNAKDDYKNASLLEEPMNRLSTCDPAKLLGTIFSKYNTELMKCVCGGDLDPAAVTSTCSLAVSLCPYATNVPTPAATCAASLDDGSYEPPEGFCSANLTIGVGGCCDLSEDCSRMVDNHGGNIGSITAMVKQDGWSAKTKDWNYASVDSVGINIDEKGDIIIDAEMCIGKHTTQCMVSNKAIAETLVGETQEVVDTILNEFSDQVQLFDITVNVVKDLAKLDFSKSINFLDQMDLPRIGQEYLDKTFMPKIEFTMDPKITDKATFGQLHVVAGPGNLTPSIEMDFSTSSVKVQASNKKG
ncbi:MAG: hypothetical protein J7L15_07310 [Clostridiales bacterium]|nr:hypothetical protein [Clostridiales bacterium]